MLDQGITIPSQAEELLSDAECMAQTGILVSISREVKGIIAISDPLKPSAPEVISILKSMNVESIMVTGDNKGTANSIAEQVGIDNVIAEAKPEQKAEKVKKLQVRFLKDSFFSVSFHFLNFNDPVIHNFLCKRTF